MFSPKATSTVWQSPLQGPHGVGQGENRGAASGVEILTYAAVTECGGEVVVNQKGRV